MKEIVKENKEEIVNMLNAQVKEGIDIAKTLKVNDKEYGVILTNLLNAYKTTEQMAAEIEFDREQEMLKKESEKNNKE